MNIRCWDDLLKYGANEVLQREYGQHLKDEVEPDYNVSLEIDLEQMPADAGEIQVHHLAEFTLLSPVSRSRCVYLVDFAA
jgi:actin related protein 2/3 complex subunit 2